MRKLIAISVLVALFVTIALTGVSRVDAQMLVPVDLASEYLSPRPESGFVSRRTSIAVRLQPRLGADAIHTLRFSVVGSESGLHQGRRVIAVDRRTVLFYPALPFAKGEVVTVNLHWRHGSMQEYRFTVSSREVESNMLESRIDAPVMSAPVVGANRELLTNPPFPNPYRTAPDDLPVFDVFQAAGAGEGYIFITYSKLTNWAYGHSYLLILDDRGEPVYYQPLIEELMSLDFKKQPNGLLTYYNPHPQARHFVALDEQYQPVRTYQVGNGYVTDLHDLQLLDNGNALMMIDDYQIVDMSAIVAGGKPDAVVVGCILQEVDLAGNVVFEWRSWDHIAITETNRSLLPVDDDNDGVIDPIRYIHCNSIERDRDGHWLLSSRHLDSITKINRQSGEVIWRLGGRLNDFTFTNDAGFFLQHDARRMANGTLTIYDNGKWERPAFSRGVEYALDETSMTATRVWQYRHTPDYFGPAMGNMQRLPNGNSVIGWGWSSQPILTEVTPDGRKVFELHDRQGFGSYRAFRFPWVGRPTWPPRLIADSFGEGVKLFFSWNGATEVKYYDVLASQTDRPTQAVSRVPRDGFETTFDYLPPQMGIWYFQVVALDNAGNELGRSNVMPAIPSAERQWIPVAGRH